MPDEELRKPVSPDADERINKRAERRKELEKLSGFRRLTSRQKDIICASLYMQDFALDKDLTKNKRRAKLFQERWWCRKAIQNLETERSIDTEAINTRHLPPDFSDASYESGDVDYIQRVKEFGYPCILLFRQDIGGNFDGVIHVVIAIGENEQGHIKIWHKNGDNPFQTGGLHEVVDDLAGYCADSRCGMSIGIRKVRCLKSTAHPEGEIETREVTD